MENAHQQLKVEFSGGPLPFERHVVAVVSEESPNAFVVPQDDAGEDDTGQHHVAVAMEIIPIRAARTNKVNLEPQVVT